MSAEDHMIISLQAMMVIEEIWSIDEFKRNHPPSFEFADGSLHYADAGECDALSFELTASGLSGRLELSWGRSIAVFEAPFQFTLIYPAEYYQQLRQVGFGCGAGVALPVMDEEKRNPVSVIATFKHKHNQTVRKRYLDYLRDWAKSVKERGVAGEGPSSITSDVCFAERWAWFDVDVAGSGQHTLNWLLLAHLNFGCKVVPIQGVNFNMKQDRYPRSHLPPDRESMRMNLWKN